MINVGTDLIFSDRFEKMVEALLSAFNGTQLWDPIPTVVALIEKVLGAVVSSMQAENGECGTHFSNTGEQL